MLRGTEKYVGSQSTSVDWLLDTTTQRESSIWNADCIIAIFVLGNVN